jgi:hypothetical protein
MLASGTGTAGGQGARGVEPTTLWLKRFILSDNSVSCGGGAV